MRASLFVTCYNDTFFPQTARATVALLRRLGIDVAFDARQTCCGQMHANTGYRDEAWQQAQRFVRIFDDSDHVVIPSTSCTAMVREQYPRLFAARGTDKQREQLAGLLPRVFELSEFLVDVLQREDVGAYFPHRVAYHPSCHGVRSLQLGERPYRLLKAVRGLELAEIPNAERCCGFGGIFAVKNGDVSSAMLTAKLPDVLSTRAEVLTGLDNSCLLHMGGALHRNFAGMRTMHLAEILASTGEPA